MPARILKFPMRIEPAKPEPFAVFVTVSKSGYVATIRRNGVDDVVRGAKGAAEVMKRVAEYLREEE